jgi:hypothetical protein
MATTKLPTDRYDKSRSLISLTPEDGDKPVHISIGSVANFITGEQLGDLLTQFVNRNSAPRNADQAAAAVEQAHRTLQGLCVNFAIQFLLAYDPGNFVDARNEGAKALCDRLRAEQKADPSKFFVPFI